MSCFIFLIRIFNRLTLYKQSCLHASFRRHMEARLANNSLVLEQSLESSGRKIASNLKNLKGQIYLFSRKRKT